MEHIAEEDLIAYRLHQSADEAAIRAHLESCAECAAVSIAETLRVFSAGPVPKPDMERNWQRLRGKFEHAERRAKVAVQLRPIESIQQRQPGGSEPALRFFKLGQGGDLDVLA